MTQQAILGTGLSGLVGSKLTQVFANQYLFENLDVSNPDNPVDITNYDQVLRAFSASSSTFVVHFAAFTDVTKAWEQKDDKNGIVYRVNVLGTENIVKAATATGKHLIHISTAYVFDGKKEEMYTEEDVMNPIEWYGQTKAWAEEKVAASTSPWTILRIDQPFRSDPFPKQDVAHRIIAGLQNKTLYPQFTNHYFGPTFIDDFAKVVEWVIRSGTTGLFHASAGEMWSDYDFAKLINETLQLGGEIKEGNLETYLQTLSRPYQKNTAMDCSKLKSKLDFELTSITRAIPSLISAQ
jgi:dTDP-4-dehydrorhamnose reductase